MRKKLPLPLRVCFVILLILFLIVALFPIYWILITSFKPVRDSVSVPIQYWPKNFTLENYFDVFRLTKFAEFFKNTPIQHKAKSVQAGYVKPAVLNFIG